MELIAGAAGRAEPILHAQGQAAERMVLGDGDVDDLVGFDDVEDDVPFLDPDALDGRLLDPVVVDEEHVAAGLFHGFLDARADVTALGLVGRVVDNDGLLRPGFEDELDEGFDDLGVGAGGHLRGPVPADVRLDDDLVAPADELVHAAEHGDRFPGDGRGGFALDGGEHGGGRNGGRLPGECRGTESEDQAGGGHIPDEIASLHIVYPFPRERMYSMIPS